MVFFLDTFYIKLYLKPINLQIFHIFHLQVALEKHIQQFLPKLLFFLLQNHQALDFNLFFALKIYMLILFFLDINFGHILKLFQNLSILYVYQMLKLYFQVLNPYELYLYYVNILKLLLFLLCKIKL
mmetsp:Transcript_6867/g.617  ORF Transcript_6867/g.617 Transcript_6867/m.617 type:complete len:127 (-) Transcript_6867:84-464(-)